MAKKTSDYGATETVTVLHSENADGGSVCVDIFARSDGSYGFELFRRDVEAAEGWFRLGTYADLRYDNMDAAVAAASREFDWFVGP